MTNKQRQVLWVLAKLPVDRPIRKLTVRPNDLEWTLPEEPINDKLSLLVSRMAVYSKLLHTFIWDGLEQPSDEMWLKLRNLYPHLVNIGTTVGEDPVEIQVMYLIRLSQPRTFSFVVKCTSLKRVADGRPAIEKLPRLFWEMLVEHCPYEHFPDLEPLVISGLAPYARLFAPYLTDGGHH
ncbi:hypothetical protein B0H16DRAFT_679861 [Mycena metata]|uniref:Uncharacterized protein n=1 Tax=Mycena metata TaxID=1033252 RepID=A0AAD7NEE6_9AGAR|nr:hypothetical protein B0H16DRAFT_679861 [Mycena metata]